MDLGSDVPEWGYGSNSWELDAYAEDDEFAAQLEACLLHSPGKAVEVSVVDLGNYATAMTASDPSDDLEGSIINIFQLPSAAENGVVDDMFADVVQSYNHVEDVGMLDLCPELISIDDWTRALDEVECSHRSSSSRRKRSYSEVDLTCSITFDLKAGATVTAFGDHWGNFGGSSPSAGDNIRWLEEDDEEPHEYELWHDNNYTFYAAMFSALFPDNEENPSATSDASCSGECSGSSNNHDNNYSFSAAMISPMFPDNEENPSATSDASCSGECSGSSTDHEVLLDWEEMIVDDCLPEVHRDHQTSAPCDVNTVQQRSSENAAPQQCAGIIMREGEAVVSAPKKYRGVVYNINTCNWEAHVWDPSKVQKQDAASRKSKRVKAGVQIYLGQYHTCEEAGAVHDKAAIKMGLTHITNLGSYSGPSYSLNFPVEAYEAEVLEHQDWSVRDYIWKLRKGGLGFSRGASGMKGVSWKKKLNKFEARYSSKDDGVKREFHLGLFDDAETAGRHYDLALLSFKGEDAITTNLRPSLYSDSEVEEYRRQLLERTH